MTCVRSSGWASSRPRSTTCSPHATIWNVRPSCGPRTPTSPSGSAKRRSPAATSRRPPRSSRGPGRSMPITRTAGENSPRCTPSSGATPKRLRSSARCFGSLPATATRTSCTAPACGRTADSRKRRLRTGMLRSCSRPTRSSSSSRATCSSPRDIRRRRGGSTGTPAG
ncbi:MAG: hypothetical protein WC483_06310 [Candidatus Paceibacterota bacterium]